MNVDTPVLTMAASTLWGSILGAVSQPPDVWLVLTVSGVLLSAVTLGAACFHHLRRSIRHRRVARELRRVHDAAYREHFGQHGRLA